MKAPPAIHHPTLHLGIPTHTKGKPKMLGSSTLFPPNRQFFRFFLRKKTKKNTLYSEKKKNSLLLPLLYFQKKDLMEILRYLDPKGKLSTTIPSLYKLASSTSPPSAPDNCILSHKSLWESLFFLGFNRFNPQRGSKFWAIFTTYKYPKLPIQIISKIKIQILSTCHPIGSIKKKTHGSPGRPCRPFRDVVDRICLRSIGGLWIPWQIIAVVSRIPHSPKKEKGEEKNGKNTYLRETDFKRKKTKGSFFFNRKNENSFVGYSIKIASVTWHGCFFLQIAPLPTSNSAISLSWEIPRKFWTKV